MERNLEFIKRCFFKGLDLRVEHTHGYNVEKGEGGHFYCDITPDEVEYLGYFAVAESKLSMLFDNLTKYVL